MADGLTTTSRKYPVVDTKCSAPLPGQVLRAEAYDVASWQFLPKCSTEDILAKELCSASPGDVLTRTGQGVAFKPLSKELPRKDQSGFLYSNGADLQWLMPTETARFLRSSNGNVIEVGSSPAPRRNDVLVARSAIRAEWDSLPVPDQFKCPGTLETVEFPFRGPRPGEVLMAGVGGHLEWLERRDLPPGGMPGQVLVIGEDFRPTWKHLPKPTECQHQCPVQPNPTVNTIVQKTTLQIPGPYRTDREASLAGRVPHRGPYFRPDGVVVVNQEVHPDPLVLQSE